MAPDRIVTNKTGTHYFLDYQEVTEAAYRAVYPASTGNTTSCGESLTGWKPIHSEALAYHPRQIKEAEAHLAKLGVPTEIDPLGRPVLTSRSHRKAVLKALRVHDQQAGYGD